MICGGSGRSNDNSYSACWSTIARFSKNARSILRMITSFQRLAPYDKLVVVCSEHSLESPPVIREIERALQKEDREHKNVLFPIRIDDYLFDE